MNIKILREFNLGLKPKTVRACEVNLGFERGMCFAYSEAENADPCDSAMPFHQHPLHIGVYSSQGQQIWTREFPMSVVPGVWFFPFMAHDMDDDGVDEIWILNNPETNAPLQIRGRYIEQINALTGETMATYPFKDSENTGWERLGEAYRWMMFGGYVNGKPVLVTEEGTYGNMCLQCYNSDMSLRWETNLGTKPGPRAAHHVIIQDINDDGSDEILFGEHVVSLDTGEELLCMDCGKFEGHSDVVLPFTDPKTKNKYIFTCRENGNYEGCPRIVMFDNKGNVVWEDVYVDWTELDPGHIHSGYVFTAKPDYRKIAVGVHRDRTLYIYDAVTGEKLNWEHNLDFLRPIDINGDGYHEFLYWQEGYPNGAVYDCEGKLAYYTGGTIIQIGKWKGFSGEQFLAYYENEGVVRLWGDADAVDSDALLARYDGTNRAFMNKMTGCGYNWLPTVDCMG